MITASCVVIAILQYLRRDHLMGLPQVIPATLLMVILVFTKALFVNDISNNFRSLIIDRAEHPHLQKTYQIARRIVVIYRSPEVLFSV